MGKKSGKIPLGRKVKNTLDIFGGLKILSITEKIGGYEYQASKMEADLKSIIALEGNILQIHFKVFSAQDVTLWIEYQPSQIHDDFYGAYKNNTFKPPSVAVLIDKKHYDVGKHFIEWDGRDQTKDRRLLLAGKYKVKIKGQGPLFPKDETDFVVAKPMSYLFGVHYKKKGEWESTKQELKKTKRCLGTLKDGTGYNVTPSWDSTAQEALDYWKECAVTYLSGHSNPQGFSLYSKDGGNYKKKYVTGLFMVRKSAKPPNASIAHTFYTKKLEDMFLVFFNGCRSGNELVIFQGILNSFFPGPRDGKHGKKTTQALHNFQYYAKILPLDGKKNPATYAWFKINPHGSSERALTKEIQKHLRSYYCGKEDGKWGDKTERAVRAFQRDHPNLEVTGLLDDPTKKVLLPEYAAETIGRNLAEQVMFNGADIGIGFTRKVGWTVSYKWGINFWAAIAKGKGVASSAVDAMAKTDVRLRKQMSYHIYAQKGIHKDTTLHPARYGRYRA